MKSPEDKTPVLTKRSLFLASDSGGESEENKESQSPEDGRLHVDRGHCPSGSAEEDGRASEGVVSERRFVRNVCGKG